MALADYYARSAVAAAQVIDGFDEGAFKARLDDVVLSIRFGSDTATPTGEALLDLLTRICARLYPTIVLREESPSQGRAARYQQLAQGINPLISLVGTPTVEIVVGEEAAASTANPVYVGASGWAARVGTIHPLSIGRPGRIGAGLGACLAAASIFRRIFLPESPSDSEVAFSSSSGRFDYDEGPDIPELNLGEFVLVGCGAIGNSVAWALGDSRVRGVVHLVDPETIDLGNLQRYVLAERSDVGRPKVDVAARSGSSLEVRAHPIALSAFLSEFGYRWDSMLLALDSARDRRAAQASLPRWIANAWTQPGDLGVSSHRFLGEGACVSCLYLPEGVAPNEDQVVADALGVSDRLMEIRSLLHSGSGVPRSLLELISARISADLERVLRFEGQPIRSLYVDGVCGGAAIPLGRTGRPRAGVHVPLAPQSALAGVLLAARQMRHSLGLESLETEVTRLNILAGLGGIATQPAKKDARGICICQDSDFISRYRTKYGF
jgi:hypothetical protein